MTTTHTGDSEKAQIQHAELIPDNTSVSEEHRQYLIEKHGTADLDPLPDMNDADPHNWPHRKKVTNLALVAFHGLMATFTAAAIQSAFVDIALDLHVSIQRASYLTSLVIAVLGGAPLFWRPLSDRYGRRPVFLISLVGSLVGNIGCAVCPSYGTMGLCRAITGFFICPAAALGSGVVAETFFKRQRAYYLGIWTVLVTLGVPSAPFIFGFVALRVGYRWIYWTLAITNAIQLLLYTFFGPETRYIKAHGSRVDAATTSLFRFRRIDPTALKLVDFVRPLGLATSLCVFIPAAAYAMVFLFASILISIEIPQIFPEQFGFNTQQVGLQNLSIIIGSLLGEQIGGYMSDFWMRRSARAEFRLWLSYLGYALAIGGTAMFLVCTMKAGEKWNISPLIGAAIAAGGNQIVTTVLISYSIDCYPQNAAGIGTFVNFVRQIWGFIGPFWFHSMIRSVGLDGSAGVVAALIVGVSVLPTVALQRRGYRWHKDATY
ncbi:major facilitator superfamily domain-containing protein [Lophiotrema nucula]|uniref:Major facilitator superfamily domain-containing protein n=1 Tax=Lophiotrema nucula TaxID=690887 RepID=A0A6A5YML1_9PLEO|nr:major facilitator superfamily domain-containing protein [Lophiotrema nucula]